MTEVSRRGAISLIATSGLVAAQNADAKPPTIPSIDAAGTLHLGPRIIPLPDAISTEARRIYRAAMAARLGAQGPSPDIPFESFYLAALAATTAQVERQNRMILERYPMSAEERVVAGVRTIIVTPPSIPPAHRDKLLINLHGGAFLFYSGSIYEAVPIAHFARMRVMAIDYRMPPAHPFPAALDDIAKVYQTVSKAHRPEDIGVFGTSAGAALTASTMFNLRRLNLPLPGALGIFSFGPGDTQQTLDGLDPYLSTFGRPSPLGLDAILKIYAGAHDPADPLISPHNGDFSRGFPPSLLISGTRDLLLSGTVRLHRKLRDASVEAELELFDGMWHGFNADMNADIVIPEAEQASRLTADFFNRRLGRGRASRRRSD